jgi:UDP-glucose 4-epimerase
MRTRSFGNRSVESEMGLDFTFTQPYPSSPKRRRVLVTGAAGRIGSALAESTHDRYELRLMVHEQDKKEKITGFGEVVEADLKDLEALKRVCQGVDTVVHLAADPNPEATWDSILSNNIVGDYNITVAAKASGCRRVVFASSIHAVSGYPPDVQVKPSDPVNPGDLYGVSKCFGEAFGRYMAEQEGLSFIAIRIGGFQPLDYVQQTQAMGLMDCWVSHRDLIQLICQCIDDECLKFAIFHGISDNRFKRLDITSARELLGYSPADDFTEVNPDLVELNLDDRVMSQSQRDGSKSGIRAELK